MKFSEVVLEAKIAVFDYTSPLIEKYFISNNVFSCYVILVFFFRRQVTNVLSNANLDVSRNLMRVEGRVIGDFSLEVGGRRVKIYRSSFNDALKGVLNFENCFGVSIFCFFFFLLIGRHFSILS